MVEMPLLTTVHGSLDKELTMETVAMVLPSDALKDSWTWIGRGGIGLD